MMPLKPRDNALFVRNFRERMRPHIIGSYAMILFVAAMIFFMALADMFAETGRINALFPFIPHCIPAEILAVIAVFQGAVLLLLGSLLFTTSPALWWWSDAAAAALLAGFIGLEGAQTIRAALRPDFAGGCGCA